MSTTDITTIVQTLATAPEETEHRLVAAMRSVARRIAERPEVVRALAAADGLPAGLIITSETQAIEIADAMNLVIQGEKALDADVRSILRIPDAMKAAVKQSIAAESSKLAAAKGVGNGARVAWQGEVRRRAAALEAKQRAEAARAAEAAAAEAALTGEDAPPVAEVAPIVVPRTVSGGAGKSGTTVRIEAKEIVDDAACPPEWKLVVRAIAEGFFRAAESAGQVKRAAPGESIVYRGVRFESVERAANR